MERVTISMSEEFAAELADFMAANREYGQVSLIPVMMKVATHAHHTEGLGHDHLPTHPRN